MLYIQQYVRINISENIENVVIEESLLVRHSLWLGGCCHNTTPRIILPMKLSLRAAARELTHSSELFY